jgi:hypothetical protein
MQNSTSAYNINFNISLSWDEHIYGVSPNHFEICMNYDEFKKNISAVERYFYSPETESKKILLRDSTLYYFGRDVFVDEDQNVFIEKDNGFMMEFKKHNYGIIYNEENLELLGTNLDNETSVISNLYNDMWNGRLAREVYADFYR